jgi:energy-coupling factor transporter ATP-binding protein EcfA2
MEAKGMAARDGPSPGTVPSSSGTGPEPTGAVPPEATGEAADSATDRARSMAAPDSGASGTTDGDEPCAPESGTDATTEAETEADTQPETGADTQPETETDTEPATRPGTQTDTEPATRPGIEADSEAETEAEPETEPPGSDEPRARVDARQLEASLLNLRKRVAALPLVFDIPGTAAVTAERTKLAGQIDDYLLPRVRRSAAPILVALVGSTGAGKSTLVNSIVGTKVSLTGVRRPTTNSPVLACHPDDIGWFAENVFLPTLPRVRQEGLARPGKDGLLVLAAIEEMPKGIALLDTPDIDSVAASHRAFAYQFLDASDLWLFMTSASRYADAPVWEVLQHARDRGAALGVVLSRVPPSHAGEVTAHFGAMLNANGVVPDQRFMIPETEITDGMLPEGVFSPVKEWLTDTARRADRRVAVLSQTMAGILDTFKIRVPKLAAHVDAQVELADRLRRQAESAYLTARAEFDTATRGARLLGGEVLARWQDYADSGDLAAELRSKRPARKGRRARKGAVETRSARYDEAVRDALEALIAAVADRAAERVARGWRADPAGAALLTAATETREQSRNAERIFASAFGPASSPEREEGTARDDFTRSVPGMAAHVKLAVSRWQDELIRLVEEAGGKGQAAGPLGLVALTALLAEGSQREDDIVTAPRRLLATAFGAVTTRELLARARADLAEHVRLLLEEELVRFTAILDEAGTVDPIAAVRLYQAEYSLEAAR